MDSKKRYQEYREHLQKIADLKYAAAVLQWDQETYMPVKGADFRARQVATLSELSHNLFTQESFKNILQDLLSADGLDAEEQKNVALSWYDYSQQEKMSGEFVRRMSEACSKSFQSWVEAKSASRFDIFRDDLATVIELKKQEADLLGYEGNPYNALLNQCLHTFYFYLCYACISYSTFIGCCRFVEFYS